MNLFKKNIKKIIIILIIFIIIYLIIIMGYRGVKQYIITHREYLSGVQYYEIEDNNLENKSNNVLFNIDQYNKLVSDYNLNINTTLDFNNYDYIYYVLYINSCGEEIVGVSNVDINNNIATVTFDTKYKCGVCAPVKLLYFIPVDKNKYVDKVVVKYDAISTEKCDTDVAYKPILYLYPNRDMDVSVRLANDNLLMTTYPKYNNGWSVCVLKDGSIYDKDNKYYYALYWDEKNINSVDFNEGFYVTKENAIEFLEDKLTYIGLNDRERNEFIMYWLPKLEDNGKSLVYFELTNERELNNRLIINPKPDSMLRINMHIKKVNKKISIKEQKLDTFVRYGFSAVEWGGTIHR